MMLNALKYLIKNFYDNIEGIDIDERYDILGELSMGTFYLSEENSLAFKKEQKELTRKYLAMDRDYSDWKKPCALYYAVFNVEKTLERMLKKKKK